MAIVGTAGHVDHGKSTLVRALTGTDPDRWAEEQQRGLTIDLGFAWTDLGGGQEVGFVDVPGHERFIKNMLAGVGAIDVAILVVAADEGWMPQSEEHLSVLDLLGVRRGVVALTRADLVDDAALVEAAALVHERLDGTSLATAPVVPVAAPTGRGLDELRRVLVEALAIAGEPSDEGRPRLWVDRSFSIDGAGTVVTGTLVGGRIAVGDELTVFPEGHSVRVRAVHHHGRAVQVAAPGSRTALNLSGLDRESVGRGAMLGLAGDWRSSDRFLVDLRTVRSLDDPLTARGAYRLHAGSGSWPAQIRTLEGPTVFGAGAVLVTVAAPIPLVVADRVIVRDVGRRAVVAGGSVLDPSPQGTAGAARASLPVLREALSGDTTKRAGALLAVRGAAPIDELRADSGGGTIVAADVMSAGRLVLSGDRVRRLTADVIAGVIAYQEANPARPGIPKASLASGIDVDLALLGALIAAEPALADDGSTVRTADFVAGWSEADEEAWRATHDRLTAAGLAVPRAADLGLDREVFHALLRAGRLVRVAPDLVYLPEQIDDIRRRLVDMDDDFTVAAFRDALGISRRQAVPLLEWLDRQGDTRRQGDGRTVRRPPSPGR